MFDGGGERRTSVVGAAAARCGDTCTVKYDAAFRVCASDSRDPYSCGAQRPALDSHLMDTRVPTCLVSKSRCAASLHTGCAARY